MKPVNNVLLILNFSPVLPVYSTLEKQPALPEYSHEHLLFIYFFCGGVMSFVIYICSWGWFQKCLSHKLSHLCVHPIVNWSEMKQQLFCVKFMIKYIPRPKKKHQPVPDKMEYASVATVTRCRRSPTEKHQLQMATNTDLNPGRLLPAVKDGTEFSAGPKNGSY